MNLFTFARFVLIQLLLIPIRLLSLKKLFRTSGPPWRLRFWADFVTFGTKVFLRFALHVFFREIHVLSLDRVPDTGPVIFVGNHPNQFIDGMLLFTNVPRRLGFMIAQKSLSRFSIRVFLFFVGGNCLPVLRPQDLKQLGIGRVLALTPIEPVPVPVEAPAAPVAPAPTFATTPGTPTSNVPASPSLVVVPPTPAKPSRGGGSDAGDGKDSDADDAATQTVPTKYRITGSGTCFFDQLTVGAQIAVRPSGRPEMTFAVTEVESSTSAIVSIGGAEASASLVCELVAALRVELEERVDAAAAAGAATAGAGATEVAAGGKGQQQPQQGATSPSPKAKSAAGITSSPFSKRRAAPAPVAVGLPFDVRPRVDHTDLYASVYHRLQRGGSLAMFPEGGSHDNPHLLPLKAGCAMFVLGAAAMQAKEREAAERAAGAAGADADAAAAKTTNGGKREAAAAGDKRAPMSIGTSAAVAGRADAAPTSAPHGRPPVHPPRPGAHANGASTTAAGGGDGGAAGTVSLSCLPPPSERPVLVPFGLTYYHGHTFRSRVFLEFGDPIHIEDDLLIQYMSGSRESRHAATDTLMARVERGISSVTLQADTPAEIAIIHALRQLYVTASRTVGTREHVDVTRALAQGFRRLKAAPQSAPVFDRVAAYTHRREQLMLTDAQVISVRKLLTSTSGWVSVRLYVLLVQRVLILLLSCVAAVPALVLGAPPAIMSVRVARRQQLADLSKSTVKLQGLDVVASYKLLTGMGIVVLSITIYSILFAIYMRSPFAFVYGAFALTMITFTSLQFIDFAIQAARSLRPMLRALFSKSYKYQLLDLYTFRCSVANDVSELLDRYLPHNRSGTFARRVHSRSVVSLPSLGDGAIDALSPLAPPGAAAAGGRHVPTGASADADPAATRGRREWDADRADTSARAGSPGTGGRPAGLGRRRPPPFAPVGPGGYAGMSALSVRNFNLAANAAMLSPTTASANLGSGIGRYESAMDLYLAGGTPVVDGRVGGFAMANALAGAMGGAAVGASGVSPRAVGGATTTTKRRRHRLSDPAAGGSDGAAHSTGSVRRSGVSGAGSDRADGASDGGAGAMDSMGTLPAAREGGARRSPRVSTSGVSTSPMAHGGMRRGSTASGGIADPNELGDGADSDSSLDLFDIMHSSTQPSHELLQRLAQVAALLRAQPRVRAEEVSEDEDGGDSESVASSDLLRA